MKPSIDMLHRKAGKARQGLGFALLEAIVALTILASVGLALFAGINQSVQMIGRAERAREADSALLNAVAWVETVNPAQAPSGSHLLGDVELNWTSVPVEPPLDGSTGYLAPGLYRVGLYKMHLEVRRGNDVLADTIIRRVGYVQVREPGRL